MNPPHPEFSSAHAAHAVIFDVDGVLVDSYQAHLESWQALAAQSGIEFSEADFADSFGRTSRDIIRTYWNRHLSDVDILALDQQKEAIYRRIVQRHFPAMDGATDLIQSLAAAGFRLALGSSGPPENVNLALERLGAKKLVNVVVTGNDVKHGKPDPEIFLIAARKLDVSPQQCVVIEDAPAGVAAAHAADMAVLILLSRGRVAADFTQEPPELMIKSLREISPRMLIQLSQARRVSSDAAENRTH